MDGLDRRGFMGAVAGLAAHAALPAPEPGPTATSFAWEAWEESDEEMYVGLPTDGTATWWHSHDGGKTWFRHQAGTLIPVSGSPEQMVRLVWIEGNDDPQPPTA